MPEYTLKCETVTFGGDDDITASRDGSQVEFVARKRGEFAMDAYVSPFAARTFARGILALCDEVDGGEVKAEEPKPRPKIGDRLRVTQDNPWACPVSAGDVITVTETRYDRGDGDPDFVRFADHHGWSWGIPLTAVEPAPTEEPLADWERDLIESQPAPIKVGDRVQIVRAEACSRHEEGRAGIVHEVDSDDPHLPYRIVDEHGEYIAWAAEVHKVDERRPTTMTDTPTLPFAAHVTEAKRLLADTDHTGADVIRLAEILAQQ